MAAELHQRKEEATAEQSLTEKTQGAPIGKTAEQVGEETAARGAAVAAAEQAKLDAAKAADAKAKAEADAKAKADADAKAKAAGWCRSPFVAIRARYASAATRRSHRDRSRTARRSIGSP
jgi:colicin import membrane protein